MRLWNSALAAVLLLTAACTDATSPTQHVPPPSPAAEEGATCVEGTAIMPCDEPTGAIMVWRFFAPPNDVLYQAPGDPSSGAPGIWLGANVTPSTCFNDLTASIIDADHDWLDDHCELELARGFAPRWSMGYQDQCPGGEPAWAAKYFPGPGIVRIAFLPAYYDDCGPGDTFLNLGPGHPGDSEMVMVEVAFNSTTQHWEFRNMWLSAHYLESNFLWVIQADRSQWVPASETSFTTRYLGYPYVAVSANKHANYKSDSKCNNTVAAGAGYGDYCYGSVTSPFRFPIDPSRNVGSRFAHMLDCVASNGQFAGNGRSECFYTRRDFAGWHTVSTLCDPYGWQCGSTPYADLLNSDKFEYRDGNGGPGPAAYSPPTYPDDPRQPIGGCDDPSQIMCTDP